MAVSGSTIGHGITVNVDARVRRATAAVLAVRPDPQADVGFVGRDHELAQLLTLLTPHPDSDPAAGAGGVVVSAVAGAPGVGKTALAQAAARIAAAQGWFPGGAVSVDLHGYDPDPAAVVWPAQLYGGLLRALGVPGDEVPPAESDQATVYHQLLDQLAQSDRPVLLVLDNVGNPDQVAELLPRGVGGHRVLITSRDTLAALQDARLLDLHILEPAAAVELLTVGLRRRHPTDARVSVDPAAADRLVELCGRLPLALQIVGALLGDEPDRPLAELADELADEGHRLRGLTYGGRWAVRAAFDLSYRRLDDTTALLFCLLAAAPGPDVGLGVAAVLADQTEPATRAGLRGLCRAHLLEQLPAAEGQRPRWRMHDLIRLYAAEHLTPDQRATGFARVLDHHRDTAELAWRRFTALPADAASVPAGFNTPEQAMDWVLAERAGLIVHITHAAATHPKDAVLLAMYLAPFLHRARLIADAITVATAAVQASHISPHRVLGAVSWTNLGLALAEIRRLDEAITAHQQAREVYREIGDRHGEGSAWINLGSALQEVRRFEEAITAYQQAREIYRETGDRHREGMVWGNLGIVLREVRRFKEAIPALERAVAIFREIGDRHGEGMAWSNLGSAFTKAGRFEEAITAHERAAEIFRETADRHGVGRVWNNLGLTLGEMRRFKEAITAHERAGEIFRETGDRRGEGIALHNLGLALRQAGRFAEAITAYEREIAICMELGDHYRLAQALEHLGRVYADLDNPQRAQRAQRARQAWTAAAQLYAAAGAEAAAARIRQAIAALDG